MTRDSNRTWGLCLSPSCTHPTLCLPSPISPYYCLFPSSISLSHTQVYYGARRLGMYELGCRCGHSRVLHKPLGCQDPLLRFQ